MSVSPCTSAQLRIWAWSETGRSNKALAAPIRRVKNRFIRTMYCVVLTTENPEEGLLADQSSQATLPVATS